MDAIITELMQYNPTITAVTIYDWSKNQILYQTSNWDISQDLGTLLTIWTNQEPSVNVMGIKYSTLQCTPERLVCQNLQGQGAIVAANHDNRLVIVGYVSPDGPAGEGYRAICAALDKVVEAGH